MKNLVILAFFLVNLFSHEIINGDVLILKFDKKSVKKKSKKGHIKTDFCDIKEYLGI